jgi:hypothetical protein
VNGQRVFHELVGSKPHTDIDISALKQGIYFAIIKDDRGEKSPVRFVIAR